MPGQQIILRLLNNGPHQIQPLGDPPSLSDLLSRPLTGPPIKSPTLINHIVHSPHRLLNRRSDIRPVAIDKIHIIHIQPLQRRLGAFDDVLSGEALVVGAGPTPEDLGGNDDVGALPSELADGLAHDLLGAAVGVDLGVVEEVDAVVSAGLEERLGLLDVELVAEADPCSVRELAHPEPRAAQILVLHIVRRH